MFRLLRTILFIISTDKNSHNVKSAADGCISHLKPVGGCLIITLHG